MIPPIDAAFITAIAVILGGLVTAWIGLRKLRPEITRLKAESDKLKAEADQARAERDSAEARAMESISNAAHALVDPLTDEIKLLREGREEDRRRIRKLEGDAAEMGSKNVALECEVEKWKSQYETLREEVQSLRRIIDDYRSGRRKPTGNLPPAEG